MTPSSKVRVNVQGRTLTLSNLDKVLYPETGTTKGEVINYYQQIASTVLPHLAGRPLTRKRWPDGVEAEEFFEKNIPRGTPEWVRTATLHAPRSTKDRDTVTYVLADDLPTLVWLANLAVLELHVPQWTTTSTGEEERPNRLVVDLDPGPPANIIECAQVALILRQRFSDDGLEAYPKTSGSKGMQLYVPLTKGATDDEVCTYVRDMAGELEREHPQLVLSRMARQERRGKVFIDWSQNRAAKTTIAPYSLRGRHRPFVSTPVTWDEVEIAASSKVTTHPPLSFEIDDVLQRIADHGDLFAPLITDAFELPQ